MTGRLGRVQVNGKDRGAGFALSPRLVVTAGHVVRGSTVEALAYDPVGGEPVGVELVTSDPGHDAAILRLASDLQECLPASVPAQGATWSVKSPPPASNDPHLHGTITTERMTIQNAQGQPVEVVQLEVDEQLGDFGGYSGSAVLDSLGRAVVALLIEQKPLRNPVALGEKQAASNVLYGIPIADIIIANELPIRALPSLSSESLHLVRPPTAGLSGAQRKRRSPATLLRPEAAIVEFVGRDEITVKLRHWCSDAEFPVSAQVIVGPGGQGKTRLAQELIKYYSAIGWLSGFLRPDMRSKKDPPISLAPIVDAASRVPGILLAIDYAETRFEQIDRLLGLLSEYTGESPIRLLLIARSIGGWLRELMRRHHDMLCDTETTTLDSLNTDFVSKAAAFKAAVQSYASMAGLSTIYPTFDWKMLAEEIPLPPDLGDVAFGSPLTLQMRALTSLLERAEFVPLELGYGFEERLLAHEQCYWNDAADDAGLPFGAPYQRAFLSRFVAAANLFGAKTEKDAIRVLTRIHTWNDHEAIKGVAEWLHWLYPPDDSQNYWGSLQPDRIAEVHLRSLARDQQDLLQALFKEATPEDGYHAVPLLLRATVLHDELIDQLDDLMQHEETVCREALMPVVLAIRRPEQGLPDNLEVSQRSSEYPMTLTSVRADDSSQDRVQWKRDFGTAEPDSGWLKRPEPGGD